MPETVVVFPAEADCARARRALEEAGAAFRVVEPPAEVARVAVPLLVIPDASRGPLHEATRAGVVLAGQVPYREPAEGTLADLPPVPETDEDCVGRIVIAFAVKLVAGEQRPEHCTPAFEGEYRHLRAGLEEIAARLGLA